MSDTVNTKIPPEVLLEMINLEEKLVDHLTDIDLHHNVARLTFTKHIPLKGLSQKAQAPAFPCIRIITGLDSLVELSDTLNDFIDKNELREFLTTAVRKEVK